MAGGQREDLGRGRLAGGILRQELQPRGAAAQGPPPPTGRAAGSAGPWSRRARRSRRRSGCRHRPRVPSWKSTSWSRPNLLVPLTTPSTGVDADTASPSLRRRSHHDGSRTPNPASSSSGAATGQEVVGAVGVQGNPGRTCRAQGRCQFGVDPDGTAELSEQQFLGPVQPATQAAVVVPGLLARVPTGWGRPWIAAGTPVASRAVGRPAPRFR